MKDVEGNKFFEKAKSKANTLLNNNDRLSQLFSNTKEKLADIRLNELKNSNFSRRVTVLIRMVKAYTRGTYKEISVANIVLMIAALIYFVTPLDLIPDFIPITGLIDDFAVVVWVYNKVQEEIDKFIDWEQQN